MPVAPSCLPYGTTAIRAANTETLKSIKGACVVGIAGRESHQYSTWGLAMISPYLPRRVHGLINWSTGLPPLRLVGRIALRAG